MTASQALLRIVNLDVGFRMFEGLSSVLSNVALSIDAGERVALVGESGCGKSVLLRAILGLLDHRSTKLSGEISFEGRRLDGMSERDYATIRGGAISMIFQDPSTALNPVFTVGEQLADIILTHKSAPTRQGALDLAAAMLRRVYIDDPDRILASYPFQLSGGMNQRVMITMALINKPKLVLADEPGTALDVTVQEQTLQLMRELSVSSNAAVLLVSHNLGVVRNFAERIYVMYAGSIVEQAKASDLFRDPRHPYTRALLAAVPRLASGEMPEPIDGMVPDPINPPAGCRFHPRCPHTMEVCRTLPPVVSVGERHDVACVLYQ